MIILPGFEISFLDFQIIIDERKVSLKYVVLLFIAEAAVKPKNSMAIWYYYYSILHRFVLDYSSYFSLL